jgi:ABC-type Zn uptake system ZnuABC Zn-binding protein ZnuA
MKKIILSTAVLAGLLAFAGCAEKQSCNTAKKVTPVKKAAPAPVVVKKKATTVVVEQAPVVIEAPVVDAKEAATN